MKKVILTLLILSILFLPIIAAKDIEVLIEHKNTNLIHARQFTTYGLQSIIQTPQPKYEIKNVTEEEFKKLKKDSSILIQKNIPRHIFLSESIPLIEADKSWNIQESQTNITGEGQTVCILDTGAQTNHPALIGKNATCNIDCLTDPNNCRENCSKTDPHGHGTHVAGIIVSTNNTYHGVTTNTKYIPVMVCTGTGCNNLAIQTGMDWCIANKDKYNISVISMSLGTDETYPTDCDASFIDDTAKINNAVLNNISVVVATGNGANLTGISSPACIKNSIKVGNTYDANVGPIGWGNPTVCSDNITFADKIVCHTNRNTFFSDMLLAPGALIMSTWINSGYKSEGGTSMSTPHVSGAIALLNQYKKVESNTTLTPNEIKTILINSGKKINDTNRTNQNYSRIDIYSAILYSDTQSPSITSMLPENSSELSQNQSFTCNATDLQLANLTIKIYNSTAYLVKNQTTSENSLTLYYQTTGGEYNWTCEAIDNNSNPTIKTNTLSVNDLFAQIQSLPEYTNQNETTFNCSAESTTELSNITFYIYNSSQPLNQINVSLTGTSNYSIFNYTLPTETNFTYFCIVENNESEQVKTINQTITYDTTKPIINLTFPANNSRTTSPVTFIYDETETNHDYCNITVNNEPSTTTRILDNGFYNWSVTCTDLANNTNISGIYKLEIYTAPIITSPSSGGGSSSRTPKTYTLKEEQMQQGITQKVKTKEIIKFKTKSQNHKLTLKSVDINKVNILLESNPLNITLYLNSPTLINLDNDKTFDLILTLTSINGKYANIFIKETNETVPMKHIMPIEINKTLDKQNETSIKENQTAETTTIKEDTIFSRTINYLVDRFLTKLKSFLELFGIQI